MSLSKATGCLLAMAIPVPMSLDCLTCLHIVAASLVFINCFFFLQNREAESKKLSQVFSYNREIFPYSLFRTPETLYSHGVCKCLCSLHVMIPHRLLFLECTQLLYNKDSQMSSSSVPLFYYFGLW